MSLGNVLGAIAPIAAGYFGGPLLAGATGWGATASSIAAGALAGGGIAALSGGDILGGAAMGGLGGYGGGGLASANAAAQLSAQQAMGTGAFNAGNAAMAGYTGPSSMMSTLAKSGAGTGIGSLGAGSGMTNQAANAIANPMGRAGVSTNMIGGGGTPAANLDMSNAGGYQYTAKDFAGSGPTAQFGTDYGISDVAGQLGGGDPIKGYGKMALTAAGPLEAAFTPEYKPYETPEDEKYDPNRTLNLNMDTGIKDALAKDSGLRLYADGGPVSTGADSSGLPIGTTYKNMVASGVDPLNAATQLKLPNVPGGNYPDYVNPLATPYEQTGIASLSGSTDEERLASLRSPTPVYGGGYDASEFIRSAGENSGVYATPSGGGTTRRIYEKMRDEGYAGGGTVQPQAGGNTGQNSGNLLMRMIHGTAPNMQTTGVPEGMSIADVIRAGRGYMSGPKGGVKLAQGGYLDGGMLPGDGMSDDVPANIDGEQEAALSQGEFVVPADVVSHLGNGSSDAGSRRLYAMMDKVRQARTGNKQQGNQINPERYMPA